MTSPAENFGHVTDTTSDKGKDVGATLAAMDAYQPNASTVTKPVDAQAANQSLVERGIIPGFNIAMEGTTVKDGKMKSPQSAGGTEGEPADGKPADEKHGDTSVKKDDQGKIKEYDNGAYTLAKHDDGKWYYHQNGDGHDFVEVDADSIKMDDKGKVTYNESGMFGNNDQTLGNGSTGGINDVTNVVSTVNNDVVHTAIDVWNDPTDIGAVFNDVKNTATDVASGVSTVATDAVHAAAAINKNIVLGVEGYGQGLVNGAIDTINHFGEEAHDGWGLPSFHIDDLTLPNQAEVDKSWGGQAGQFIGGLGGDLAQGLGDTVVELGKATYNGTKMAINDGTTLIDDAINDPSKLGSDFENMGQQALDFGKGFVEGIAIKPINAVIGGADSALNWATDSNDFDNRFKLGNLVDEEYERTHEAAKIGDVGGNAALQVGLVLATDGLSEAAIGAGSRLVGAASRVVGTGSRTAEGVEEGAAGLAPVELPKETPRFDAPSPYDINETQPIRLPETSPRGTTPESFEPITEPIPRQPEVQALRSSSEPLENQGAFTLPNGEPIDPHTMALMKSSGFTPDSYVYRTMDPKFLDMENGTVGPNPNSVALIHNTDRPVLEVQGPNGPVQIFADTQASKVKPGLNVLREDPSESYGGEGQVLIGIRIGDALANGGKLYSDVGAARGGAYYLTFDGSVPFSYITPS